MKRDIRINFGQLEDLCTTIANYRKELSDLQILSEELYQVLTAQTSNRLTELAEQWQERVIKKENQLGNRLEAIQTLLSNYIYEMGNYIQPKDPDKLTQVDRNDIWWNLQQIVWEISSVYDPGGLAGTYYEPYNCEENDESVWKEDLWEGSVKQRQNREANYAKLRTFQTSFQNEILSQMQTDVWSIYDNHIVPYEETDDFYKEEALKYYLEYATFEDHCLDLYRREEDFGRGLNDQLKEIFEGLRVLSLFADETTRNAYINGELDEENTELMGNFIDGFREFFADPIGVLEAMGQKTMDRYEEEGLCYAAGYLSIDAGLTVCGGLKGLKSLTSLKFVDNATATAQLAKHAENVVDIVDDTTDMAKIVENGNDVADSASDVGKVAEGGAGGRLIPGTEGVVTGGDSTKLGKNMMESMGLPRGTNWTGYQAQHIIPAEMANHPVLQRIGMDLDDASNGLFLRTPADDISAMSRHRGYHSTYNEFVRTQLDGIDINQSVDVLQKQVYDLQQNLKYLQQSGLPLYPSQGATVDLWQRSLERIQ